VNGIRAALNICQPCAVAQGLTPESSAQFNPAAFAEILRRQQLSQQARICPNCRSTSEMVARDGKAGCPLCYTVHWTQLEPGQWQRSRDWELRHKGKEPLRHGHRKPKEDLTATSVDSLAPSAPEAKPKPTQMSKKEPPLPTPPPDKIPEDSLLLPPADPLAELQSALRHAIADEDYEHAAQVRDQIRKLREGDAL
jgi:protein-arginine kinase activator protein McsA